MPINMTSIQEYRPADGTNTTDYIGLYLTHTVQSPGNKILNFKSEHFRMAGTDGCHVDLIVTNICTKGSGELGLRREEGAHLHY